MTTSNVCPDCGEGQLRSPQGLVDLQKKHGVWDGQEAAVVFFCGSSPGDQSETCKIRVENSISLALSV